MRIQIGGITIVDGSKIYERMSPHEAICFMNDEWKTIAILTREGDLLVRGTVQYRYEFIDPEIEPEFDQEDVEEYISYAKRKETIN